MLFQIFSRTHPLMQLYTWLQTEMRQSSDKIPDNWTRKSSVHRTERVWTSENLYSRAYSISSKFKILKWTNRVFTICMIILAFTLAILTYTITSLGSKPGSNHNRKWIFQYKSGYFHSVEKDVTKRLSMITCINNLSPATLMVFYPAVWTSEISPVNYSFGFSYK